MFKVDLSRPGIWRRRGEFVPQQFYQREAHPVHVMVWGAIGPNGWRYLVRCPQSVNRQTYLEMVEEPIQKMKESFSNGFIHQQDNASPHKAALPTLQQFAPILQWLAKSRDLSPIEQVWSLIKHELQGKPYSNPDMLF
jgi:hypothetical protein